jgi:hypothetical protein
MPITPDWRSATATEKLNRLDRPGFAQEFLRRNREYQAHYRRLARKIAAGAMSEEAALSALARRWGLSFRLRSDPVPDLLAGLLAPRTRSRRRRSRRRARALRRRHRGRYSRSRTRRGREAGRGRPSRHCRGSGRRSPPVVGGRRRARPRPRRPDSSGWRFLRSLGRRLAVPAAPSRRTLRTTAAESRADRPAA